MTTPTTELTLCRLLGAWVNGAAWDAAAPLDFEALYHAAERQLLTAAACAALEHAGLMAACPPQTARRFREAKAKSIRKTLLMDAERQKLLALLEQNGIWYAPLKGAAINALYPQYGTRRFADNDILFDAARWRDVRRLMRQQGYTVHSVRTGCHDTYHKPPFYNFEMHRRLFIADSKNKLLPVLEAYYADVRQRLCKDTGNRYGYHFSDEDQYVYTMAHAYKHYSGAGTGLRTVLDLWLYRHKVGSLDEAYIEAELNTLGIGDFERRCRALAEKLFGWPQRAAELTTDETEMLGLLQSAGSYGTTEQRLQNDLHALQQTDGTTEKQTRRRYLLRKFFPPLEFYRSYAPFAYRHHWAIPFVWVYRLLRGVLKNGKKNIRIFKMLFGSPNSPPPGRGA